MSFGSDARRYTEATDFYYCEELGLGLVYNDTQRPVIGRSMQEFHVYCVALSRLVKITFMGRGRTGLDLLRSKPLELKDIYPVDLYHIPHILSPKPSRRVSEEAFDLYCEHIGKINLQESIEARHT